MRGKSGECVFVFALLGMAGFLDVNFDSDEDFEETAGRGGGGPAGRGNGGRGRGEGGRGVRGGRGGRGGGVRRGGSERGAMEVESGSGSGSGNEIQIDKRFIFSYFSYQLF